jgi:hypothetical protein
VRDNGNVTDFIHSAPMSVGQPASVDGNRSVIAASARPTILASGICPSLTCRQAR